MASDEDVMVSRARRVPRETPLRRPLTWRSANPSSREGLAREHGHAPAYRAG